MMEFDELKLACVIDAAAGIDGRVKLQKIVYLLTVMGYDLPFDDFVIRQHGPYSRRVAWATDLLSMGDFIDETSKEYEAACSDPPLVEYSYTINERITPLIRERFGIDAPEHLPPIDEVAVELKGKQRAVLEVAATRLFLEQEEELHGDELNAELERLKDHLSAHFDDAEKLIKEMVCKSWL